MSVFLKNTSRDQLLQKAYFAFGTALIQMPNLLCAEPNA